MAYIDRQQIEDYLKINADILFKSDFEIKEFLNKLYSIPMADVVPRSEVERLQEELEKERVWANSMIDNLHDDIHELQKANQELALKIFDEVEKCVLGTIEPAFIQTRDKYIKPNSKKR